MNGDDNGAQNTLNFGLDEEGEYVHVDNDVVVLPPESDTSRYAVVKSNRLITAQNRLNLNEQKVLAACISLINPQGDYPNGITVELSDSDISTLTGIPKRTIGRFAKKAAYNIQTIPVRPMDAREDNTAYVNIAHRSEWFSKEKIFRITFHEDMEQELLDVVRYTKYMLNSIQDMTKKHSLSIYELCSKMFNRKKGGNQVYKMRLNDLHYFLAIINDDGEVIAKSYYEDFYTLRRSVLQPCFDDINSNEKANLTVSFKEYKSGKSVAGIHINICERKRQNVTKVQSDSSVNTAEMSKSLLEQGINTNVIDRWIDKFGADVVQANFNYYQNRQELGGTIKNPVAYLNKLLINNIAQIPEIANPYSDTNSKNLILREFLARIIVPVWWKMPKGASELIQESSHILNFHPFQQEFMIFEEYAKSGSIEDAVVLCSDQDELLAAIKSELK